MWRTALATKPQTAPPTTPIPRMGAYILVIIAGGRLSTRPIASPVDHCGIGSISVAARKPIAKRLMKAARIAVFLSGMGRDIISATVAKAKTTPMRRPKVIAFMSGSSATRTRGSFRSRVVGTGHRNLSAGFQPRQQDVVIQHPALIAQNLERRSEVDRATGEPRQAARHP